MSGILREGTTGGEDVFSPDITYVGRVPLLRHTLESGVHWWLGDFRRLGCELRVKK